VGRERGFQRGLLGLLHRWREPRELHEKVEGDTEGCPAFSSDRDIPLGWDAGFPMRFRLGRISLGFGGKRTANQMPREGIVWRRPADGIVVTGVMIVLLGLGVLSAVLGALATGDAARFWQDFGAGVALLAGMTLPIWFLQRWQSIGRPVVSPEKMRTFRQARLALLALWLFALGTVSVGLAMNLQNQAPLEANLAVGLLIAYIVGWALLVFPTLRRPSVVVRPIARWFTARFR